MLLQLLPLQLLLFQLLLVEVTALRQSVDRKWPEATAHMDLLELKSAMLGCVVKINLFSHFAPIREQELKNYELHVRLSLQNVERAVLVNSASEQPPHQI